MKILKTISLSILCILLISNLVWCAEVPILPVEPTELTETNVAEYNQ